MIEQKVKVTFPKPVEKTVTLGNQDILVESFIRDSDQKVIIEVYLKELFGEENGNYNYSVINAENALILSILNLSTNLMTVEGEGENEIGLFSINDVLANMDFIKEVLSKITNYKDFRNKLESTVEMVKEQKRIDSSLGNKLDLIYARISNFVDDLTNSDISSENISSVKGILDEINNSEILKKFVNKVN